ncbi:Subtilisin-like protease 1 [Colletotrichum sp. SAR 10_98]|nr:Subtilisin-like protease 1 [Colletotrichum sp. SAR 10_98]
MIFAKENTVKADADGFGNTLAGLVGADNIDTIVNDAGLPYAWRANLNPDQHEKVKNDRVIAGTDINDPLTRDDDPPAGAQPSATQQKRAEVTQTPIAKNDIFDLRVLSTPPREKEALPNYRYDDFAGQGITIYVVDTGPFDLQHEEFRAPSPDITRRELNVARNKKFTLEDTQHGTCVASKTVGGTTGAAKRANLVGVRIDFTEFGLLRGLQSAANEIKQKGLKGKAVVTTSILMRAPDAIYTTSFRSVMRSFVALDVPIVAAAGNKFLDGLTEPDKLPATMAKDFPVIVVGNAGKDFKIAPKSQRGNLVTTYAIGADIKCADPLDLTGLATDSGTSFAAPQVAGMVAYWMSHPEFAGDLAPGKVAETLRNMTGALSYPRVAETGYPPIAWNGHDLAESCSISNSGTGRRAKRAMRRDLGQACSYAPTSVASAAPTASAPAGNAPPSGSDVPTATTTSVTETATAGPTTCNLCGAMLDSGNAGNLGGQVGCDGAEYARSSCEANADCKSWAYGNEDRGTYTIPVCLLFTESATQIVSQAPPDPEDLTNEYIVTSSIFTGAPSRTSSAPPTTVTVSNGETIAVAAGVLVVGGVGGGFFTLNGVTTAVPAGAAITAGSTAQNPENPEDPGNKATKNPEQQTPSKAPSNAPSSSAPASTSGSPTTSSAAPTGTAAEYMIFVNRNTTKADADGFGNTLKTIVGDQPLNSIVDENGIAYMWRTKLRPDQLDKVKADRVVVDTILYQKGAVEKDPTPDPEDKDPEVEPALGPSPSGTGTAPLAKRADHTQLPTAKNKILDLRTLSTPPQTNGILDNFFYEDPAGEGITVYHIDIGPFAMDHDEFKMDSKARRETIEVNLDKENRVADADHGTCAASKIVGQGVIIDYIREVLQVFQEWDIPVVCPSGNNGVAGQTVQVNEYPALFADKFPVIVVGSTSRRLEKSWFSQQGNLLTTWAVGENVRCSSSTNLAGLKFETGTSFAGPQVAGIAAYFMSHPDFNKGFRVGSVAADARDLIGATSFPRITHEAGYPSMAWNLWGSQQACSPGLSDKKTEEPTVSRTLGINTLNVLNT